MEDFRIELAHPLNYVIVNNYIETINGNFGVGRKSIAYMVNILETLNVSKRLIGVLIEILLMATSLNDNENIISIVEALTSFEEGDDIAHELNLRSNYEYYTFATKVYSTLKAELKMHKFMPYKIDINKKICYVIIPDI